MAYWTDGLVATLLVLGVLLALATPIAAWLQRSFPMPRAMVAGLLGYALGPSAANLLPVARPQLESLVYHGLALVFICLIVQRGSGSRERSADVRTLIFSISGLAALQGAIGVLVVIVFSGLGSSLHTGFGLMGLLGFSQGPGQALSLGGAWEAKGFTDGGQVGLIVASLGFLVCTLFGSGWLGLEQRRRRAAGEPVVNPSEGEADANAAEAVEDIGPRLTRHLLIVAGIYLATYGALEGLDGLIDLVPSLEGMRATVWGFHFVAALGFGALFRALQGRMEWLPRTDDRMFAAFAGIVVEFTTCAAITAVSGAVFLRYAGPILSLALLSAGGSLLLCVALRRWAFVRSPFEHAIGLFGAATGTLLTGLALLRVVEPDMHSDVARNQVLGSAGAIPLLAPVMLGVLPYLVSIHSPGSLSAAGLGVGIFGGYFLLMVGLVVLNVRRARRAS